MAWFRDRSWVFDALTEGDASKVASFSVSSVIA